MKIGIIDLEIGNVGSVQRALSHLKIDSTIIQTPNSLDDCDKLIFPGVGSFAEASRRLTSTGFKEKILSLVNDKKMPILGICLGMQLLFDEGEEEQESKGLGLIKGRVLKIKLDESKPLPHMGWNDVHHDETKLFQKIPQDSCFYFVHTYEAISQDNDAIFTYTDYGKSIVSSVEKNHIYGTQFHPEKSQKVGLQLLRNFCHDS